MPRHASDCSPTELGHFELNPHEPIVRQVYTQLRDKILSMEILPDEEISEAQLALAAGVSRTPARHVVKQLVDEGLLHSYPSRGTFVSRIDVDRVREHSLEIALSQHESIVDSIECRDPDRAHQAMQLHMEHNEELLATVRLHSPDLFV